MLSIQVYSLSLFITRLVDPRKDSQRDPRASPSGIPLRLSPLCLSPSIYVLIRTPHVKYVKCEKSRTRQNHRASPHGHVPIRISLTCLDCQKYMDPDARSMEFSIRRYRAHV